MLLDNALSAVDHHTAQHIFQYCVKDMFRDKATVLVTHQVEFLNQCDKVAIMDDGKCVYFGPWNEGAAQLLNKYLPVSHILAAAGNAEQPRDTKKKPAKKDEKKVRCGWGLCWAAGQVQRAVLHSCCCCFCCLLWCTAVPCCCARLPRGWTCAECAALCNAACSIC